MCIQVGVVGRTGAGKSSLINAIFHLTPICNGRILIDNVNVAEISVKDLRQSFAVVPQSPFLFEGSLRYSEHQNYVQAPYTVVG